MNGEIITDGEMRQAGDHAMTLRAVMFADSSLTELLKPVENFLEQLHWKGQQR